MSHRIIAFDNLRSIVCLAIVLYHIALCLYIFHAAQFGFSAPLDQAYFPELPNSIYTMSIFFFSYIIFFVDIFFFLGGFFAHWVCQKKGLVHFVKNRFLRIALPLLFYYFVSIFSYFFIYMLPKLLHGKTSFIPLISVQLKQGVMAEYFDNTSFFWFINVLLWYVLLTALLIFIRQKISFFNKFYVVANRIFQCIFGTKYFLIFIPTVIVIFLMMGHHWYLLRDTHFIPNAEILAYHAMWYVMGWCLYQHRALFAFFQKNCGAFIFGSFILFLIHGILFMSFYPDEAGWLYIIANAAFAFSLTLCVPGFIGLFLRYFDVRQSLLQYVNEGSYWIYVMHVPIVSITAVLVIKNVNNYFLQFFICFLVFLITFFPSYHWLIKKTWLRKVFC